MYASLLSISDMSQSLMSSVYRSNASCLCGPFIWAPAAAVDRGLPMHQRNQRMNLFRAASRWMNSYHSRSLCGCRYIDRCCKTFQCVMLCLVILITIITGRVRPFKFLSGGVQTVMVNDCFYDLKVRGAAHLPI